MIKPLVYLLSPGFAKSIVYMLQSVEYRTGDYLKWFWRVEDFRKVMYRRKLVMTKPAKLLFTFVYGGMLIQFAIGLGVIVVYHDWPAIFAAFAVVLSAPVVWGHLVTVPLILGDHLIVKPRQAAKVKHSAKIFKDHKAVKIAIAGSYGKTSMKEMLVTVLSEGKKVAATEANKNVAISHALFAKKLDGSEDIVILEYGEGAPGDVAKFARTTKPDIGIITGLAPAHLDRYKTLNAAGRDIFSLAQYVKAGNIYVNFESEDAKPFIKKNFVKYDSGGADGWKVSKVKVSIDGLNFVMKKGRLEISVTSAVLGKHQVGPLSLICALAYKLGLSINQIETGVQKITPFEHRMQPYRLGAAWVIDDSYNGNIDGMEAGLALLAALPAKRKIYITPGLVDQGPENKRVHLKLGSLIAKSGADTVVLMDNSVKGFILEGLDKGNFKGKLRVEKDPLAFYKGLDQLVAAGDLVLIQNDWTDNYN